MIYLLVGLGNAGERYQLTRHNAGSLVVEEFLSRTHQRLSVHKKTNTEIADLRIDGQTLLVARTRGFMNASGQPVARLCSFFRIPPDRLIVAFDDMEREFGTHTLVRGGGDHGHNGLKSISSALKTKDYYRLALGIGRPPGRQDPASFVLQRFSKTERDTVPILAHDAAEGVVKEFFS